MNINAKRTKDMLLGPVLPNPPPQIVVNEDTVERVTSFRLFGVVVANNLWEEHDFATHVYIKANKRRHFLKQLKRLSVTVDDLSQYYKSAIRPVIEYVCQVWESRLTIGQRDQLESIQRLALKLLSNSYDYELYCSIQHRANYC
jgi:hypothetical protein